MLLISGGYGPQGGYGGGGGGYGGGGYGSGGGGGGYGDGGYGGGYGKCWLSLFDYCRNGKLISSCRISILLVCWTSVLYLQTIFVSIQVMIMVVDLDKIIRVDMVVAQWNRQVMVHKDLSLMVVEVSHMMVCLVLVYIVLRCHLRM